MATIFATVHHDPDSRMVAQAERVLPLVSRLFSAIAIRATDTTPRAALAVWEQAGALIRSAPSASHRELGRARRGALELGLEFEGDTILFCDLDRLLHWAEFHPAELEATLPRLSERDFTVLGRTARAFDSHPLMQTATERIVNDVFARVSGHAWDVTAAARGLRRAAAEAIVQGYHDDGIGSDTGWPLFLEQRGFAVGHIETEGLEFETPDRFGDQIEAAGGLDAWLEQGAANLDEWMLRLIIARDELEAMTPFSAGRRT